MAVEEQTDLPPPAPLPPAPRGGEVVTRAIRRAVARIAAHDPLVRRQAELPDGDTPVHQLRVGVRRLRGDLQTFEPLVEPAWADSLRRELRWLAGALGAVRDLEVLRARLWRTAADPVPPVPAAVVARFDAVLAGRAEPAGQALAAALDSARYLALRDALAAAAARPPLTVLATASAREVLPGLVAGPWQAFAHGRPGHGGAADLAPEAPDERWHAVRVRGKRARYAVEVAADLLGPPATELARRLAAVQELLGEHQDAAVAGRTWLAIAESDPENHRLAVAAGRLYERERAAVRLARAQFPAAWRAASRRRLVGWLR
jgi:CHAD domain-containing protein